MSGKKIFLFLVAVFITSPALAQQVPVWWGLELGGYGELHYNDVLHDANAKQTNGVADLRRFVFKAEYRYNDRFSFLSEINLVPALSDDEDNDIPAIGPVHIDMRLLSTFNIRAGLIPVPAGFINMTREPSAFHGVERPNVETYLIPAPWHELGIGFFGEISPGLAYETYLMAGLNPGEITGPDGIRHARQNSLKSSTANLAGTGRISYAFNRYLTAAISGYVSTLGYQLEDGEADKVPALKGALFFLGEGHIKYKRDRFETRGLFVMSRIDNIEELNEIFGNVAGQTQAGGYIEIAYDILPWIVSTLDQALYIFGRYESYDTNFTTGEIPRNNEYLRDEITGGFSYRPSMGLTVKADYQLLTSFMSDRRIHQVNVGIGYEF